MPIDDERHEDVSHAAEQLSRGLVLRVLVGTLSFSLALCFVAYVLLRGRESELHADRFAERNLGAPHDVSEVKETLFQPARRAPSLAEIQRRQLDGYQWIDRRRRVARIPIAQAMDAIVARAARTSGEGRR